MVRIGIVGAGAAAAAATHLLCGAAVDTEITILEKSRELSGRAATRRREGVTYDYGANYVKSDDERVSELLTETLRDVGLVDVTDPVWTFDREGRISEGDDRDDHKWTSRRGLARIAKRLVGPTDATVHRETRATAVFQDPETETWRLEDDDGRSWGPYDALLLNPPAPQTATLLRSTDRETPVRESLADAAERIPYRTIWTGVLHYPFELERPYYALVNTDRDHALGWVSREECKPGHVPTGESLLVVQANPEWSLERFDEPPAANLDRLATLTADLLGDDRLRDPDWTDHQGFRYALPDDRLDRETARRAEREGLYCLGDWVAGEGRVHAALRNGLEVGRRVVDAD